MKAVYEFVPQDARQLPFRIGDIINVVSTDESGWWHGTLNGSNDDKIGLFPANYVNVYALKKPKLIKIRQPSSSKIKSMQSMLFGSSLLPAKTESPQKLQEIIAEKKKENLEKEIEKDNTETKMDESIEVSSADQEQDGKLNHVRLLQFKLYLDVYLLII